MSPTSVAGSIAAAASPSGAQGVEFQQAADYAAECSRALLTAAAEMTAAQEQLQKATAAYDKADAEHKRAFADALRIARAGTTPPANPA